ncbi:Protein rogdi-like [Holothuria leucospilota]|uniref:Protein rogdi-like n=1 Tax=Holothuria leucospilota TaxID=206669 RepID=A0A9Q1CFB6_HOLLE|nr:Protein rogdi-like [Holothuria leucospilota]
MADDSEEEEKMNLEDEFNWLLEKEVHSILGQIHNLLEDCSNRFLPLHTDSDGNVLPFSPKHPSLKSDTFVLSSTNGNGVKGVVTLTGDVISKADISLRYSVKGNNQILKTCLREDSQILWRVQQIQDAGNHLKAALDIISDTDPDCEFETGEEVVMLMDSIMSHIQKGQQRLLNPAKPTLEDVFCNKYIKGLYPPLPPDMLLDFYLQGAKLVLKVYHLHASPLPKMQKHSIISAGPRNRNVIELGTSRFEIATTATVDSHVPWVGDVITCLTFALQLCQSLKDKIQVFSTYWKSRLPPVR